MRERDGEREREGWRKREIEGKIKREFLRKERVKKFAAAN